LQFKHTAKLQGKQCHEKFVRQELVDGVAWRFVKHVMKSRALFQKMLKEAKEHDEKVLQPMLDRLATDGQAD